MPACRVGLHHIPPDVHAANRLQAMRSRGEHLLQMDDLARLLHDRVLFMLGDSMTFQITEAMRCAAAGSDGGLRTVRLSARAPQSMVDMCRRLMEEAGRVRACGCKASADKAWRASSCGLWADIADLQAKNGTFSATGFFMPKSNFTFAYDFDRVSKYVYVDHCYVCDAERRDCAKPVAAGPHRRRGLLNVCATHPLPSRVELAGVRSGARHKLAYYADTHGGSYALIC
jgi:hypothetical protein